MKDENYIVVQGWMRKELGLKGYELLAYALIFGFCQDGESTFKGSLSYVAEWLGCSKPTAISTLKNLVSKGLLERIEEPINGILFVRYRVLTTSKEILLPSKEILPNKIDDNIDSKKDNTNVLSKKEGKKQDLENLGVEVQGVENQGQLITDLPSTENKEKPTTEVVGEKTDIKNHIFPKAEAEKAINLWNSIPSLPNVIKLSDKRKSALKNLLKEYDWGQFEQVIENIRTSSFLNGTSGRWQCSFDWILNRNNFLKVLEGQYKDREQNEQKSVGKVAHKSEEYDEGFDENGNFIY